VFWRHRVSYDPFRGMVLSKRTSIYLEIFKYVVSRFLSNRYIEVVLSARVFPRGQSAGGVRYSSLTPHVVPRSRMSKSYIFSPLGSCMAVAGQLYFYNAYRPTLLFFHPDKVLFSLVDRTTTHVPCHHVMGRHQLTRGGSSSTAFRVRLTTPSHKKLSYYETCNLAFGVYRVGC
jgi:hypothetical protein